MLIEMRLLSSDFGDAKRKPEQYRVERQAVFQCEVLSKQILHGINNAYKSKRQYKDHSFQGRFQITGERRTISIVQMLYDLSIEIYVIRLRKDARQSQIYGRFEETVRGAGTSVL